MHPKRFDNIIKKLTYVAQKYGYNIYAAGGYVRDLVLNKESKDLDVMVAKDSEKEMAAINFAKKVADEFKNDVSGFVSFPKFGTAKLTIDNEQIDFIIPRKEVYNSDSRKPEIAYGDIKDDYLRRDFTVNSLYIDLFNDKIIDPSGHGLDDIKNKVIRATNNPNVIFSEDPLRMLRAIRQSHSFGFSIDEETKKAIKNNIDRLDIISKERIRDEFVKILNLKDSKSAIRDLKDTGLLDKFMPELSEVFGVDQTSKAHTETLDEHILDTVEMTSGDTADKLVALLHDIGKPAVRKMEDNMATFYNHETVGAELAEKILKRLKFPNDFISNVVNRIKFHMRPHHYTKDWGDKAVRKLVKDLGEHLEKVLNFAEIDIKSSRNNEQNKYLDNLNELRDRINKVKQEPQKTKQLLDGVEIMQLFNIPAGPNVGKVIKYLNELELENPNITKEEAIGKIKDFIDRGFSVSASKGLRWMKQSSDEVNIIKTETNIFVDLIKEYGIKKEDINKIFTSDLASKIGEEMRDVTIKYLNNSINYRDYKEKVKDIILGSKVKLQKDSSNVGIVKHAFYPNHPDNILDIINMSEKEVWEYYNVNKNKILPKIKGFYVLFKFMSDDGLVIIRKDHKTGKFISINSEADYNKYNNGRNVEWHITLPHNTSNVFWIDIDPHENFDKKEALSISKEIATIIQEEIPSIDKVDVYDSGGRGYHIYVYTNKYIDIYAMKNKFKKLISTYIIGDRKDISFSKIGKNGLRIDLTTLHKLGSLRCPFSLNMRTGRHSTPIRLNSFQFDPNSTQNEGRYRLKDPNLFKKDTFRRWHSWAGVEAPDGITFIVGELKNGGKALQAIRFDKAIYDESKSYAFIKEVENKPGFDKTWTWDKKEE